jgi:hypothetical protein
MRTIHLLSKNAASLLAWLIIGCDDRCELVADHSTIVQHTPLKLTEIPAAIKELVREKLIEIVGADTYRVVAVSLNEPPQPSFEQIERFVKQHGYMKCDIADSLVTHMGFIQPTRPIVQRGSDK